MLGDRPHHLREVSNRHFRVRGTGVAIHSESSNAFSVTVTHVVIYPDDWNGLNDGAQNEYTASAAAHGIVLTLGPSETTNSDQLVTISNGDATAITAPHYLGPVRCSRARWEHNLRELLDMDDPCFPNPFRGQRGSIRSL
jgi:hypothetical protein